ncbi:MAG: GNAT family N-acetyltransferase, partial [Firmicutes bacterium]|nr:GNAT family N-acetyltransferase [Bacillota bacterium]
MIYNQTVILKDARMCIIKNGTERDGERTLYNFILTHQETDNLIQYPDEIKYTVHDEEKLMKDKKESPDMVE